MAKGIVLDANILIRAVLGRRVLSLLETYETTVDFFAPEVCFDDAEEYLPGLLGHRGNGAEIASAAISQIKRIVKSVDRDKYREFEVTARRRMTVRDEEDWPVAAAAILLGVPIWTEDGDFFGCGIATWTTDRVEMYLQDPCDLPPP